LNIEKKLEIFAKSMENEARAKREDLLNIRDKRIKTSLEKIKKEAVENAEKTLEQELSKLKQIQNKEISSYKLEAGKKLILKRAEFVEKAFFSAGKKIEEYTDSEQYREQLYQSVQAKLKQNPDAAIILCPKDHERLELINAVSSDEISLGGYKTISADGKRVIDNTFAAKLNDMRENFQGFTHTNPD